MEDLLADEIGATMEMAKRRTQEKTEESETAARSAARSAAAAADVSRNLDATPMTSAAVNPLLLVRYFST